MLQINKLFYPHIGGVEKVVLDVAQELQNSVNMSVLVTGSNRRVQTEYLDNIRIIRTPSLGTYFSMPVSPTFPFWLRKFGKEVDILHFHYPFPLGDVSYLLSGLSHQRIVLTWHSDIVKQLKLMRVYRPLLHKFLSKVDKIVVTSPNLLHSSNELAAYKDKCEVVPLGIDVNQLVDHVDEARVRELESQFEGVKILFVGRLVYYKGVEYLIRAVKGLSQFHLIIVGDGPLRQSLMQLATDLDVAQRVTFWGRASEDDLRAFYQACDIFVLPSVESSEAYGLVQLEAMAFGKPVVSTNLPTGVPYVNSHNHTGFVNEPRDVNGLRESLRKLVENRELSKVLGENGKRRVNAVFNRKAMGARILRIYETTVN